jgi:hypothetical protein
MQHQPHPIRSPSPVSTRKRSTAPSPAVTNKRRTVARNRNNTPKALASFCNSSLPSTNNICNIIDNADNNSDPQQSSPDPGCSGSCTSATNIEDNINRAEGSNNEADGSENGNKDGEKDSNDGDDDGDEDSEDDDGSFTFGKDGDEVTPSNMFDVVTEADKEKYLYGSWWNKDDIKVVLQWFFVPANAERYHNPGKTSGLRSKDIKLEIAGLVNSAMNKLEQAKLEEDSETSRKWEKPKVYDEGTAYDKYRQLRTAYDKCVTELSKAGDVNKDSTRLVHVIKKITPYYKELFGIFGSRVHGKKTVPSRESGARGKSTPNHGELFCYIHFFIFFMLCTRNYG